MTHPLPRPNSGRARRTLARAPTLVTDLDNLNTHNSECLVCLVNDICDLQQDLGTKGRTGVEQLNKRVLAFIDYFNKTMAKPFKWTYTGRPLVV